MLRQNRGTPVRALLAAALLAGCLGAQESIVPLTTPGATLVAHAQGTLLPVPGDLAGLAARILAVGAPGAEPTLGLDRAGALYVTGGDARVWKSADGGATWRDVSDRTLPRRDFDPYLWVDPATDRIFSLPLNLACAWLHTSDDGGATWTNVPTGGCGLALHDHQSLVTGPPPAGVETEGYPSVAYYAYNSRRADGTWVTVSLDGGATWEPVGRQVFPRDCQDGLAGAPAVAPDGTVYLPKPGCAGLRVGVSKDAGQTWTIRDVQQAGMAGSGTPPLVLPEGPWWPNPAAAVDDAGHAYVAYGGDDGRLWLTRSFDGGATWTAPVRVSPPDVTVTVFSAAVAGETGRLAVAYLGTTAGTDGWARLDAQAAPAGTRWDLYATVTLDGGAEAPTFTTLRVTPEDDPAQSGCVGMSGEGGDCRNLLDFLDVAERDGAVWIAFSDGCARCRGGQSSNADLHVAALDGVRLRDGPTPRAPQQTNEIQNLPALDSNQISFAVPDGPQDSHAR